MSYSSVIFNNIKIFCELNGWHQKNIGCQISNSWCVQSLYFYNFVIFYDVMIWNVYILDWNLENRHCIELKCWMLRISSLTKWHSLPDHKDIIKQGVPCKHLFMIVLTLMHVDRRKKNRKRKRVAIHLILILQGPSNNHEGPVC